MVKRSLALCILAFALSGGPAHAQRLRWGSPAPKLEVKAFLKGQPIKTLEKGKVHVVEFWATWCGPCAESIPQLTKLQKQYPQVTFIGVSVWEDTPEDVKPFVARMGAKMDYRVAVDLVPPGKSANDGKMSVNWMKAAGKNKIPTAFIIDREGRVAWVGNAFGIEAPLAKIVAGRWNIQAEAAEALRNESPEEKVTRVTGEIAEAQEKGEHRRVLALVDRNLREDRRLEPILAMPRFRSLYALNDPSAAAYGRKIVDNIYKEHAKGLDAFAWALVKPEGPKARPPFAGLALQAAKRADSLSSMRDASVADTLARAYFVNGDAKQALEVQRRCINLCKGTVLQKHPEFKGMQARLAQYQKAAR